MSLNEQVWATLAPSNVHGIGVFAIRNIQKGQKIYAQSVTREWVQPPIDGLIPEIQTIILQRWPLANQYPFMSPNDDARLLSFMNHGIANYDPATDCVSRDIQAGEEIFEDYGENLLDFKIMI